MKYIFALIFTLSIAVLFQAGPARAETLLNKDQAVKLIVGNTISGKHFKGFTLNGYINPNGIILSLRKGKIKRGTWVFKGNAHCITFKGKKEHCRQIYDMGGGKYEKRRGDKVILYFSVLQGNAKGLE